MDGTTTGDGPMVQVTTTPQYSGQTMVEATLGGRTVLRVQLADALDPEQFAELVRLYITARRPLIDAALIPPDVAA